MASDTAWWGLHAVEAAQAHYPPDQAPNVAPALKLHVPAEHGEALLLFGVSGGPVLRTGQLPETLPDAMLTEHSFPDQAQASLGQAPCATTPLHASLSLRARLKGHPALASASCCWLSEASCDTASGLAMLASLLAASCSCILTPAAVGMYLVLAATTAAAGNAAAPSASCRGHVDALKHSSAAAPMAPC